MADSDPPRRFYTVLFGAGILAVIAGSIAFVDWVREKPARTHPASSVSTDREDSAPTPVPSVAEAASPAPTPPVSSALEPSEAASIDPARQPPPVDAGLIADRPPREELTEAETLEKKQQAIALLDRTIKRLEKEIAAESDPEEVKHLEVRLERVRKLREKRVAELSDDPDAQ